MCFVEVFVRIDASLMQLLRRTTSFITILAAIAATAVVVAPAPAQEIPKVKLTPAQAKLLWATVNICDTAARPDTVGIAGSMPVIKGAKQMFMRFRLQYYDESSEAYKPVPGPDADSQWEVVDPGKGKYRSAGHDFVLGKPKDAPYTVRGEVQFQWRRGKKVLLTQKRPTTAGHPRTIAPDPKRFSAANCTIRP